MTFVYLDGLKRSKVDKISKKILKHFKYKKKLGPIKIITFLWLINLVKVTYNAVNMYTVNEWLSKIGAESEANLDEETLSFQN